MSESKDTPDGAGPVPHCHWSPSAVRPVGHRTAAVCGRRHPSTVPPDRHPELADDLGRGRASSTSSRPAVPAVSPCCFVVTGDTCNSHPDCWPASPRFFRSTTCRSTSLFPRPLSERSSHGSPSTSLKDGSLPPLCDWRLRRWSWSCLRLVWKAPPTSRTPSGSLLRSLHGHSSRWLNDLLTSSFAASSVSWPRPRPALLPLPSLGCRVRAHSADPCGRDRGGCLRRRAHRSACRRPAHQRRRLLHSEEFPPAFNGRSPVSPASPATESLRRS